ncbi:hypothetical protein ABT56_21775 [Photobacterium aquae]|uniref:Uncharacterized protein n=1 Tax=Photobacterium aquae TaxID=1195763 RepID=A0A0J1JJN8_9GAMM|nr:hypothetical protein ABT56_21775 [Photobacterium aquae]
MLLMIVSLEIVLAQSLLQLYLLVAIGFYADGIEMTLVLFTLYGVHVAARLRRYVRTRVFLCNKWVNM